MAAVRPAIMWAGFQSQCWACEAAIESAAHESAANDATGVLKYDLEKVNLFAQILEHFFQDIDAD